MSEEKSEWKAGDVAYVRAVVSGRTTNFVRTRASRDTSEACGYLFYPDELIEPETLVAELAGGIVAERDALRAELTTTRDDLQRTAAAMWEPLRGVAKALGYHRASAPDFGEVDEVAVREWAEVLKERRVAQQTASRELADVLRERVAALEGQLAERADERDRAESRLAIAERVIGRAAIDRAMEVE